MTGGCSKYIGVDRWCQQINEYLHTGKFPNDDYLCQACKWKQWKAITNHNNRITVLEAKKQIPYSGYCIFPEFSVMVCPPLDNEVHVQGCGKYALDPCGPFGAWHFVVDVSTAIAIQTKLDSDVYKFDGSAVSRYNRDMFLEVEIDGVHPHHPKKKYSVKLVLLKSIKNMTEYKGLIYPISDMDGFLVINPIREEDKFDILVVAGVYTDYKTKNDEQ